LKPYLAGKRYVRIIATRAPPQNANKKALIPKVKPKRKPTPRNSAPSAKPIHFPFDTNQRKNIGKAKINPAKISSTPLSPKKNKMRVYKKDTATNVYRMILGRTLCLRSYTKSTTKSELTIAYILKIRVVSRVIVKKEKDAT